MFIEPVGVPKQEALDVLFPLTLKGVGGCETINEEVIDVHPLASVTVTE
jgi:hypothetical protein